jgi:HNH endonuclease
MKEIPLTRGKVALVDDEDYESLIQWKWLVRYHRKTCYARRIDRHTGKPITIHMHREILGVKPNQQVDHINGNGLDNRRSNLRIAGHAQNLWNRGRTRKNSSGFKGVHWVERLNKWCVQVQANGKARCLGWFVDLYDAASAYDLEALKLHGEFAHVNFRYTPTATGYFVHG